ncbi:MAG: FecCD family ABC transporter permease [Halothermotrichaceae bacterium]
MNHLLSSKKLKIWGLIISIVLLIASFMISVAVGQISIPFSTVVEAFTVYNQSTTEHIIIRTTRLSRAVIALVVGASLAIAGALMQAITRNPLASPSIFGINAGALFFIVFTATFFPAASLVEYMWIGFLGALIAEILVYFLGSLGRDGLSSIKIVLAGAAITALFLSFTQGLLVINQQSLEGILFWLAGSVAGRSLDMLKPILPYMTGSVILALFLSSHINILMSGEDVARGLGQRTILIKVLMGFIIVFLAGGSVAVAGSIGFIGLIVPHIARIFVGNDYRWVISYSMVLGGTLLLMADVAARFIIMPQEMPIGVVTALIGAPFFIFVARRGFKSNG